MWKVYRQRGPQNNDINSHGLQTDKISSFFVIQFTHILTVTPTKLKN